jgi:acyl carrier protein
MTNPDPTTVDSNIRQLLAEQLGVNLDDIKDESNIVLDLNADSLEVIELVLAIEEHYDIEVSDEDAQNLATVADIVAYVQKRIA